MKYLLPIIVLATVISCSVAWADPAAPAGTPAVPAAATADSAGLPAAATLSIDPVRSVAVVQRLLDAKTSGNNASVRAMLTKASSAQLGALTPAIKNYVITQFDSKTNSLKLTVKLRAFIAMLIDDENVLGYGYTLIGPKKDDPGVVLVKAGRSGQFAADSTVIEIVTAKDDLAGGAIRVDATATSYRCDPDMPNKQAAYKLGQSEANMRTISTGINQYAQDHGNKLPDADKWVDEIMPYIKTNYVFQDPADPNAIMPAPATTTPSANNPAVAPSTAVPTPAPQRWSYAYNVKFSGLDRSKITAGAQTVIIFDSTLGTKNAADSGESIPATGWHKGSSVVMFADGDVALQGPKDPPLRFAP